MYNDATLMDAIVNITKRSRPRRGVPIPNIDIIEDTRTDVPPAGWWERAQAFIATQRDYKLSYTNELPERVMGATSPISVDSPWDTPEHEVKINALAAPASQFGTVAHEFSHVLSGDICMTNSDAYRLTLQYAILGTSETFEHETRAALVETAVTAAAGMAESPVNLGYLMDRQSTWGLRIDDQLQREAFLNAKRIAPILIGH